MTGEHEKNLPVKVDDFRLYDKARASFPDLLESWSKQLEGLDVKEPGAELVAAEISGQVAKAEKLAEHMAKTEAFPLKDALDVVKSWWKPILDGISAVRMAAKDKAALALAAHRERERQEREEAARVLEEARRKEQEAQQARFKNDDEAAADHKQSLRDLRAARAAVDALPPPGAPTKIRTDSGTLTPRVTWTYELLAINEVPSWLLKLDEAKVRAEIARGAREIPGLRIYQEETLVQTTEKKR